MCYFISWIEKREKVYFLTFPLIHSTPRGEATQKQFPGSGELIGHGAIRAYFELNGGIDKECSDFSDSKNFPADVVKAIKAGEMRGMGQQPEGILTPKARAEYDKVVRTAYAEYDKVVRTAYAEYDKVVPARAEYDKVVRTAYYDKVVRTAYVEYIKVVRTAYAEEDKVVRTAYVEYDKVVDKAFWDIFQDVRNRTHTWR